MTILPKFLWDSAIRGITPTFSGTTVSGAGPANATDWRDFSFFTANTGNLDYVMTADTAIDAVSAYVASTGTGSIVLQYESSPSTFTTLATLSSPAGKLSLTEFTEVTVLTGRKIRFVITAGTTLNIRQLVVGPIFEAETGQYQGMTDPVLQGGLKYSNTIAMNGSIIQRSIKRTERTGTLDLTYLSPAFVRGDWQDFATHSAKLPFIYAWNYSEHPTSIAFSVADISPAKVTGPGDLMSVSWKLRHLVADEFTI